MPTVHDNGSLLQCRAYNPRLLQSSSSSSLSTMKNSSIITSKTTTRNSNIDGENRNYIESVWRLEVLCK